MSNQPKITALSFDASGIAPQAPMEVIPGGWYNMEITDAEVKAVRGKSGGTRANFELTVTTGDYKGRKVFAGINVKNANAQAQEIGQRELSAICHATGIINVSDLAAFVGKRLQVKVKVKKASEEDRDKGYEDRNEPSGFKALDDAAAGVAGPPVISGPPPVAGPPPITITPPVAAPVAAFPPAGWTAHPSAPGHFYQGQDVKTEAELRAMLAAPAAAPAPVAAPVPPPIPTPPPLAPVSAPVTEFPPAGWVAHPSAPGWFYEVANTANMKDEATLRAMSAPASAPVGPPMPPAPAPGSSPPWRTPTA